jgi:hypothetical protein
MIQYDARPLHKGMKQYDTQPFHRRMIQYDRQPLHRRMIQYNTQPLHKGIMFHPDSARKLSAKLYDIRVYHCCVYSEKLLMMDSGTVRNM